MTYVLFSQGNVNIECTHQMISHTMQFTKANSAHTEAQRGHGLIIPPYNFHSGSCAQEEHCI